MRVVSGLLFAATASPDAVHQAALLYQRADYANSLRVLAANPQPDAANFFLTGQNYFMSGDFDRAIRFFEKALAISPGSSDYELWLGRAWGRLCVNISMPA